MLIHPGVDPALGRRAGIAAGLLAAFAATRGTRALLFGVTYGDPVTYGVIAAAVAAAALTASYVPARSAASVDPAWALRTE